MARDCAIIPTVRNQNGELVESRLFKDLLTFTNNNRREAVDLYLKTKNSNFIQGILPRLELDENNEPTFVSLLNNTNISENITRKEILKKLNKDIGGLTKDGTIRRYIENQSNFDMLLDRARNFNGTSQFRNDYVATVAKIGDRESTRTFWYIQVQPRNKFNSFEANQMEYNASLNEKLRDILAENGISIGALTELERRRGVAGVADFSQARDASTGLIELIRLAEGNRGEQALPEEFAHFVVEAMPNNQLMQRLINTINDQSLAPSIIGEEYESYNTVYEGNTEKLAKEAVGKLIAKHLLRNEEIGREPYRNLLQRTIDAIKNFFSNLSSNKITRAMIQADQDAGTLAESILTGQLGQEIDVKNISTSEQFFNIQDRVNRDQKLLQRIINTELKRLNIYQGRGGKFDQKQQLLIDQLERDLATNKEIEGIYNFVENALEELQFVSNRLTDLMSSPNSNINEKAKVLRNIRNYLYSYNGILQDLREQVRQEESYEDNRYGERVRILMDQTTSLLNDLYIDYNKVAQPLFVDFIKPFLGNALEVPFGKFKGRTITAEQLVEVAHSDISFFDRWLDSMADSSDHLLKVMDKAVKLAKENARFETIERIKQLQAAHIKLEQAGINNTEWMFERDSNGNLTGNYITEVNHGLYRENLDKFNQYLINKYGENPVGTEYDAWIRERKDWYKTNSVVNEDEYSPNPDIYANPAFTSLNPAQREYYNTIMSMKQELDSFLPEDKTTNNRAVQIRRDLVERVKNAKNISGGLKEIQEAIKDQFIRRSDDTDFGDRADEAVRTTATITDFEGHEVQKLPVYYVNPLERMESLSLDVTSTMAAYTAMAEDFKEMNKVIDVLELGRDLLREREVAETRGGKPLVERLNVLGRTVENKVTKRGSESRIVGRLNDFFSMQVYGRYMADEGSWQIGNLEVDKGKVANFVNYLTSLNSMAFNLLLGISNVATGSVMHRIESVAGEFFTERDTIIADRTYAQALPQLLGEVGNRVQKSKLALWMEEFNVLQDFEQSTRDLNMDRKTWVSRMFKTNSMFFLSNAGEHWMQTRTSLALANQYKLKSPNGKLVNLWEAMEVVPIDPNNKKLGARLQLRDGYTKEDGSAWTREDTIAFGRKAVALNERFHGIYNKLDKSALQRLAIGRMAIMFRKWLKPSLNRRFKNAQYNLELDAWTEGYYITTGRFLKQLGKDIKNLQFNLVANWGELTSHEKANIKRAITEVAHWGLLSIILGIMEGTTDKDTPWAIKMAEYQARRLQTELGIFIPGPPMLNEAWAITKSPAAGVRTLENISNLVYLLNPYEWIEQVEHGRYEDHSKAYKRFFDSPVVPFNNTIYRVTHPEDAIAFYKMN